MGDMGASWGGGLTHLAGILEHVARIRTGRRFSRLSALEQQRLLGRLHRGSTPERLLVRGILGPLRAAHFDDAAFYAGVGEEASVDPPVGIEIPRWRQNAMDLDALAQGEEIEAEVVVVGSGAGGAVVAAELARQGIAVVLLEEGGYFDRRQFDGRALKLQGDLYRDITATTTVGNCWIPVPVGRTVGGSTTINNATCYRAPPRIFDSWRREFGLVDLTETGLEDAYQRVERFLEVERASAKHLGGGADVVARGCEALGFTRHGAVLRNAPDCDGQGLCCWGCPTEAKRSTNASYVPLALRHGAQLFYHAKVEGILTSGGRAWGVNAVSPRGKRLVVRANAVVLSAGSLMSPLLLLRHDLANGSGEVGRNLSIHPAVAVVGVFPEKLGGSRAIPQGYAVEEFHEEGLLYEGAFIPAPILAAGLPLPRETHTAVMEAYDRMAIFGFMIEDTSRGRIRLGPSGRPLLTYWLNRHDVARFKRGMEILFRIYLAAGAEVAIPPVVGHEMIRDLDDINRFRRAKIRARHLEMSAYHPLGTARMGSDPRRSVVDSHHETHDVRGLFVVDGSSVPSSIGVNPQLTIMALATRAARFIAERATETLDAPSSVRVAI